MPKDKKPIQPDQLQAPSFHLDPGLKSVWVDSFNLAVREDGIIIVRAAANLPEGLVEQTRFVMSRPSMENFIDMVCTLMKYSPKNTEHQPETKEEDRP